MEAIHRHWCTFTTNLLLFVKGMCYVNSVEVPPSKCSHVLKYSTLNAENKQTFLNADKIKYGVHRISNKHIFQSIQPAVRDYRSGVPFLAIVDIPIYNIQHHPELHLIFRRRQVGVKWVADVHRSLFRENRLLFQRCRKGVIVGRGRAAGRFRDGKNDDQFAGLVSHLFFVLALQ